MQKPFTLLLLFCSIGLYAINPPLKRVHNQQGKQADQPAFSCSMPAYLLQGSPTDAYSVNLSTGETTLVKNNLIGPGVGGRQIQAVGYNVLDNYLWGYRTGTDQLVRIGGDWSVQFFTISGLAIAGYDVGDIDANGIMYLSTGNSTIKRIDLNPASPTYLQALSDLTSTGTTIADWTVNVVDGNIYAINQSSLLLRYNTTTGVRTTLGVVQWSVTTGTGFGAAYSDSEGNVYVQDNQGGKIFKIDKPHLLPASTNAQIAGNLFANTGMTTSSNDGTRCMNAPPPCQAPARPDGYVTPPGCLTQTGSISLTAPTGTNIQYNLNGGVYQAGTQFAGLSPGSYTVTARNDLTSCVSGATTFTIAAIPAAPSAPTANVVQPTCAVQTGTLTIRSPLTGVEYSFDNGTSYQAGNAKAGFASGVYQLKVRSTASGCESGPVSATVNAVPEVPDNPTASVVQPTCAVLTGTLTINTPSGGVAYSFDNGASYQAGNAKSGLASGVYQLKVRSTASGCESGPVSVTVNAAPEVPASPSADVVQPTCAVSTGTITINTPSSGVAYSFDNGASYQAGNAKSGLASGVYLLKVRSTASGCESGPVSVTVNAAPEVPAAPTANVVQPTCTVSTGTIAINTPSSGVTYSFDNGASYQAGNAKGGLASGVYQLKVRSTASDCESEPVSVTVNAAPAAPSAPTASVVQPTCTVSTGTIAINTPSSGVEYSFDNGASYQAGNAKSGLASGVYQLKVRSTASGCESAPVSVTVNAAPEVPASPSADVVQPTCAVSTGTITINTPSSGVAYSFDNGASYQAGNAKSGLASGVYLLKVRSAASGCESGLVSVTVNAAPEVPANPTAGVVQPTCVISTGAITISLPSSGVVYSFDNGASYQAGNAKSDLASGVYQLKVRSTASGCESGPVSVTLNAAPEVPAAPTANVVQPTCTVSTGTIAINTPSSGVTYSFDNGASYQAGNAKSGLVSGPYLLRVRSTASGCESALVSVTVNAAPEIPAIPTVSVVQPTCAVSTGMITVSWPSTGVEYSFDNGASYQAGNAKSGLASGVYLLKVRSTASGCESGPVSVTVNAAPEVPATPTTSVVQPTCAVSTGTVTINTPSSGVAYSFDNGTSYQAGNAKSGLISGVYLLKVRSTSSGCESGPVSVTVNAAPGVPATPTASVVQPTCTVSTGTITINTPSSGVAYSFDNGLSYQAVNVRAGLASGVYQLKVRSTASGCESGPVSVTVNAAPAVPANPSLGVMQPTCTVSTGTITISLPSTGVEYSFDNGASYQAGNAKSGLASGVYSLKVRSTASGCESGPVSVTVNAAPAVPANPTANVIQPTCAVSTGTITISLPSTGVTYSFDNSASYQAGNAKSGLGPGVYQLKVRSTASGCESAPVSVAVNAAPEVPAAPTASVLQPTCTVLTGTIMINTPASGVAYSFDNGTSYQVGNAKSGLASGVYRLRVRSTASGCESGSVSVTVNAAPELPAAPTASVVQPTCAVSTGTITVSWPSTGVEYSFDNIASYQAGNAKSGLASGAYLLKVRSTASGCESAPVSVTVNVAPEVPANPTAGVVQPTCVVSTGTITINTPSSGVAYSFDNGTSYQAGNAKGGLASGVYQLKVRSTASGCESGPVSVTVNAAPEVPANPTANVVQPTCAVSTGTITISLPSTSVAYSFDNGLSYQAGNAKGGLASGVYQLKVRSTASGCESGPVSATVNADPAVPASPSADVVQPTCAISTGTITVNTPSSDVAYSFDNGLSYQAGNTKSGLVSGVYQLKVRSTASGCESALVSITVNAAPEIPANPTASMTQPTCTVLTGTIMINTPASGVAYSFDNGTSYQSGNAKGGLASGVYQLRVRSTASGCESGPVSVTVNAAPEIPANPTTSVTQPTCAVSTGMITVSWPSTGVEYSFDNGASYQAGNAKSDLTSGVYSLKVRLTASGCESGPVSVTVNAAPEVPAAPTANVVQPTCAISTGTITVNTPSSGVAYSFDNGLSYQAGNAKSGLVSGIYLLKVRSTASGCESGPVSATVNAAPEIPANPTADVVQPTCTVSTGTIAINTPSSGVAYSFDNGVSYQAGNAKSGLPSGVYPLKVRSVASGCESGPVSVTVNAASEVPANPTAGVVQPTCALSTGTITVNTPSSGVAYSFDNGLSYQAGNTKSGLISGVYQLRVRSTASGCESGPFSVTVNAAPEMPANPMADVVQPTCAISMGTITVNTPSSGVVYSFDNGLSYQAGNAKSGLASGIYLLKVRSTASGCESGPVSATVNAAPEMPANPMADVVQPTCAVSTGTITINTPSSGVAYSFDNGASYQAGNEKSGLASGVYQLKVRSMASGCESGPVSATVNAAPAVPATPTVSVVQPNCLTLTGTAAILSSSTNQWYSFNDGGDFQESALKTAVLPGTKLIILTKDKESGCLSAALSVTISDLANCPPVARPNAGTVLLGSSLTGNLLADDHDPEGGNLRINRITVNGINYILNSDEPTSITIPGAGTLLIGGDGTFTFLPTPAFTGPVPVIDYVVSDDAGAMAMSTLSLFVNKVDLQVVAPRYDCLSGKITIQVTGGDGTPIDWRAVGLTGWTTNLSGTIPDELRNDPKTIILYVRQSGYVVTYAFDLVAACGDCSPGPDKPLRLKTPVLNCKESTVCIATCGGDGSAVTYKIDNVSEWKTEACVMVGDDLVHRDPKILFVRVRQGTQEQVFEYNLPLISAACPDSTRPWNQRIPVAPPPPSTTTTIPGSPTNNTGQPMALLEPLYSCGTGVITFRYQGGDGRPVEYMAVGVTGWTTQAIHHVEEALRLEQPPVLIYARQGSSLVSYLFDLKGYCQKAAVLLPPPATTSAQPASPSSLTLLPPVYDCQTGGLRFQVAGGDNSPVEFMAVGITGWTTRTEHTLEAAIRESGETVRIFARQQGIVSSLLWNPAQVCGSGGRQARPVSGLQVQLLENPVLTGHAILRLTGLGAGKRVTVLCYDSQGRFVSSTVQETLDEPVRISVALGQIAGIYVISILADGQQVQVKAVKP